MLPRGRVVGVRVLYLHGFASGPGSKKGVAVSRHLAARGVEVERLDLRVPAIERLRLSTMIEVTRAAIQGSALLIGSSLGGLVAARTAEVDARVARLILLAPAFRFEDRWRARLGDAGWDAWMRDGGHDFHDHQTGGPVRIDAGFARDAAALDQGWPDVRVPTTILHGIHDDVVPIATSREFAATRPHVSLIELEDNHELLATLPSILDAIDQICSSTT